MSTYAACNLTTNAVVAVINDPTGEPSAPAHTFLVAVPADFDGVGQKYVIEAGAFVFDPSLLETPEEVKALKARALRKELLASCDWTQMPDTGLSASKIAAWRAYRQALRDLPNLPDFPHQVAWPAPPT